jgi:NAD(P)-dependent dehydrogenase (short-subunit alcohol dehydrogenase family)
MASQNRRAALVTGTSYGIGSAFVTAEEMAAAVRYLASPAAYVTGQTLLVDGGLTAY